jgi:hypothetical protein
VKVKETDKVEKLIFKAAKISGISMSKSMGFRHQGEILKPNNLLNGFGKGSVFSMV